MHNLWKKYFEERGIACVLVSCTTGEGLNTYYSTLKELLHEKIDRDTARGMKKQVTTMVLGVPNVGKSTFINRIAGERRTKAEDRAGVTRGKQWVRLNNGIDLLDMPGLLWHKFEDMTMGLNLAYTGAINDKIIDIEGVAASLCKKLAAIAPDDFCKRYKLKSADELGSEPLTVIGKKRGFLRGRGEIDTERTAIILLDEFRGAKIGRITLEFPEDLV
jgi:ribosome biogenesis GTPase A